MKFNAPVFSLFALAIALPASATPPGRLPVTIREVDYRRSSDRPPVERSLEEEHDLLKDCLEQEVRLQLRAPQVEQINNRFERYGSNLRFRRTEGPTLREIIRILGIDLMDYSTVRHGETRLSIDPVMDKTGVYQFGTVSVALGSGSNQLWIWMRYRASRAIYQHAITDEPLHESISCTINRYPPPRSMSSSEDSTHAYFVMRNARNRVIYREEAYYSPSRD